MSSLLGSIAPFDIHADKWDVYWETLEQYFIANQVDDKKLTATFITLIGKDAFSLLRALVSPEKPSNMKIDALNKVLHDHLQPSTILITGRYKFYKRDQDERETITDYVAALRKLSLHCEFKEFLNDALRDKFVCGIRDHNIRKRLLVERKLDVKSALELAKSLEKSAAESRAMENERKTSMYAFREQRVVRRCYHCNSTDYLANICIYKDKVCNNCKLKEHLAKACRNKKSTGDKQYNRNADVKSEKCYCKSTEDNVPGNSRHDHGREAHESPDDEIMYINKVVGSKAPLSVNVEVEKKYIEFEVDTGSGITVISEYTFRTYFGSYELNNTDIVVKTYSNQRLNMLGKFSVNVKYEGKTWPKLVLYVIQGNGVNLLGRNWLFVIKLNWSNIFQHRNLNSNISCQNVKTNTALENLMETHSAIFREQLGTITGLKAKLHIKSDAKPKYCKARNVPFALTKAVEDEIDRLEKNGIIKSVSTSEWASPVVLVPKPDGTIRLCGDYKSTVNPVIENEVYPQPTPDEMFAKMQGGKKFSKIDLTQAYAQVELEEESKQYLVINTSKGLKEPSRMPYGIKPATGIFQRHVVNALSGIERTVVKVDDILVSGVDDADHLVNLGKVFDRINQMGATVNKKKVLFFC